MAIITKVLNWTLNDIYIALKPTLISAIAMALILLGLKSLLYSIKTSNALILIYLVPVGIIIYACLMRLFFIDTYNFIWDNVVKITGIDKIKTIFSKSKVESV